MASISTDDNQGVGGKRLLMIFGILYFASRGRGILPLQTSDFGSLYLLPQAT